MMKLDDIRPGMTVRRIVDGVIMRVEELDDSNVLVRTNTKDLHIPGCYWYSLPELDPVSITLTLTPEQAQFLAQYIVGSGRDFMRQLVTDITAALKGTL